MRGLSSFILINLPKEIIKTMTKKTIIILSKMLTVVVIVFLANIPKKEKNTPKKVTIIGIIHVCDNLFIFTQKY